jgi:uncharacterized protein YjdB
MDGCKHGIYLQHLDYSTTFEHVTFRNQTGTTIQNNGNAVIMRSFQASCDGVRFYDGDAVGTFATLIDGDIQGAGTDSLPAINFPKSADSSAAQGYVRNVTTHGFRTPVEVHGVDLPGKNITEWASARLGPGQADTGPQTQPIVDTPDYHDAMPSNWFVVDAMPDTETDSTVAIQAALDSGKSTIALRGGAYKVSDTLHVRNTNVRRIIGMNCRIQIGQQPVWADAKNPKPLFSFEAREGGDITLESMELMFNGNKNPGCTLIKHDCPRDLILKDITNLGFAGVTFGYFYENSLGCGRLFVEDVSSLCQWNFAYPQQVYARQFNPEGHQVPSNQPLVHKNGGSMWILGIKTEWPITAISTYNGSFTEILGGQMYPVWAPAGTFPPAFRSHDGFFKISVCESAYQASSTYQQWHVNVGAPGNDALQAASAPMRTGVGSRYIPLYVSANPTAPVAVSSISLPKQLNLVVSEYMPLTATISPELATNKVLHWSSSQPEVATVRSTPGCAMAEVFGVGCGTSNITATAIDGSTTAVCSVTCIDKVLATEVAMSQVDATLAINQTLSISAQVLPKTCTNKDIQWTSDNASIATVDSNGMVTATGTGQVGIVARSKQIGAETVVSATKLFIQSNEETVIPIKNNSFEENRSVGQELVVPGWTVQAGAKTSIGRFAAMDCPDGISYCFFQTTTGDRVESSIAQRVDSTLGSVGATYRLSCSMFNEWNESTYSLILSAGERELGTVSQKSIAGKGFSRLELEYKVKEGDPVGSPLKITIKLDDTRGMVDNVQLSMR